MLLSREDIGSMKRAGSILKECLELLSGEIREGVSAKGLEVKAGDFIASHGARAAFLGYNGYPASICVSPNFVVVHGIPSEKQFLVSGDIVSVDVGVEYKGCFADAAATFPVGEIAEESKRLVSVTEEALYRGIKAARAGNRVQDISWAIQSFVESKGFNVVRSFVGHGIGKNIHEPPEVPNFGAPHKGVELEDGMALAIEPMVNIGTSEVEVLADGWTVVTKDRSLSAHFEHTVIINGKKAEIVT